VISYLKILWIVYNKIPLKSEREDGFRNKAETCSCHGDSSFKHVFYAIKVVEDSQLTRKGQRGAFGTSCDDQIQSQSLRGVPRGRRLGVQTPPPEIPKALQNRAKLNPILENWWI